MPGRGGGRLGGDIAGDCQVRGSEYVLRLTVVKGRDLGGGSLNFTQVGVFVHGVFVHG